MVDFSYLTTNLSKSAWQAIYHAWIHKGWNQLIIALIKESQIPFPIAVELYMAWMDGGDRYHFDENDKYKKKSVQYRKSRFIEQSTIYPSHRETNQVYLNKRQKIKK